MIDQSHRLRSGLSLLELLVAISIVGLLISLAVPALQHAREAARRNSCQNNLREQGTAMTHYEQAHHKLPSGGEGTNFSANPPKTLFEIQSTFSMLVPYLDDGYVAQGMNPLFAYNDYAWPANQAAARVPFASFLCPSNAIRTADPNGYAQTDYMPVVYTDIDPSTGVQNPSSRKVGAFGLGGTPVASIVDGMSRTIAISEDAGRNYETSFPYTKSPFSDPVFSNGNAHVWNGSKDETYTQWLKDHSLTSQGLPPGDTATPSLGRVMNRWAEPASAGGISGQPNSLPAKLVNPVNGNAWPWGGPPGCSWGTTNCGPNEETWSWHMRLANVLMCDGSVRPLGQEIDPRVLRKLITASEQDIYDDSQVP